MSELDVRPLARFFRALSDETRLRMVALLAHGELCVCQLESALSLTQSNASRQLAILKAAGVVDSRRDGTWVHYRLSDQDHEVVRRLLAEIGQAFGARKVVRDDLVRMKRMVGPGAAR